MKTESHTGRVPCSDLLTDLDLCLCVIAAQLEFVQILVIVVVMMVMVVVITCLLNHYRLSARSLLSRHAPTRRRHLPLANVSQTSHLHLDFGYSCV